jgi:hypothetical protein
MRSFQENRDLLAHIEDAMKEVKDCLWRSSLQREKMYLAQMESNLDHLAAILDRVVIHWKVKMRMQGEPSSPSKDPGWTKNTTAFLDAFKAARDVRGSDFGPSLSSLAARLLGRNIPPDSARPLKWQEIEIVFISEERVRISSNGIHQTYNYIEFGFEDKRNGTPNEAWVTLREMAKNNGTWPRPPAGKGRAMVQKRIQEIREALRHHFQIQADPIPFNGNAYQVSLKLVCGPSFDS